MTEKVLVCYGACVGGKKGSQAEKRAQKTVDDLLSNEMAPREALTQTLWPQFYFFLFLPRTSESWGLSAHISKALETFITPEKAQGSPYNGSILANMLLAICYIWK